MAQATNVLIPDIIRETMMYLHPASLHRLMLTNKWVYQVIRGNKRYFDRYAVFLLYRKKLFPYFQSHFGKSLDYHESMETLMCKVKDHIKSEHNDISQIVRMYLQQHPYDDKEINTTMAVIKEECRCFFNDNLYVAFRQELFRFLVYVREQSGLTPREVWDLRLSLTHCFKNYIIEKPDAFDNSWFKQYGLTPLTTTSHGVDVIDHAFKQWLYFMRHYFPLPMAKRFAWKKIVRIVKHKIVPHMKYEHSGDKMRKSRIIYEYFNRFGIYTRW